MKRLGPHTWTFQGWLHYRVFAKILEHKDIDRFKVRFVKGEPDIYRPWYYRLLKAMDPKGKFGKIQVGQWIKAIDDDHDDRNIVEYFQVTKAHDTQFNTEHLAWSVYNGDICLPSGLRAVKAYKKGYCPIKKGESYFEKHNMYMDKVGE